MLTADGGGGGDCLIYRAEHLAVSTLCSSAFWSFHLVLRVSSICNTGRTVGRQILSPNKISASHSLFSITFSLKTPEDWKPRILFAPPPTIHTHSNPWSRFGHHKLQLFPELFIFFWETKHQDQLVWNCSYLKLPVLHCKSNHWCHGKGNETLPQLNFPNVRHFLQQILSFSVQNIPFFQWKWHHVSFKREEMGCSCLQ